MRCPILTDLPSPPKDKIGWPWTEESPQLPDALPDGLPWPRVSIVTPSYNQGQFIEETIRSVLLQGYPDLEYIVIDGGSTDESVEIIHKYEPWLAHCVSEPDQGQAHAISKGWQQATGDIVAYLNSDDVYLPNAIATVASTFQADSELALGHGDLRFVDSAGRVVERKKGLEGDFLKFFLKQMNPILQPSAFLRKSALDAVGGIDLNFHMLMDFDLWSRIGLRGMKLTHIPADLSLFRMHREAKSSMHSLEFSQERWRLIQKCLADPVLAPKLASYRNRLYAAAHLRSAERYWLCRQRQPAYAHYWKAVRMVPTLALSRRGLGLLVRFILRRRVFPGRFRVHVE